MITPTFLRFVVKPNPSQGSVGRLSGVHGGSDLTLEAGFNYLVFFQHRVLIKTQSPILFQNGFSIVENFKLEDF